MLEPEALRIELERPRVAVGQGRLDLPTREIDAFGAGVEERSDALHQ